MPSTQEIKAIRSAAGHKIEYEFSYQPPFIRRLVFEFGGNCGCCGRWNWQWTELGQCQWTYACESCCEYRKETK
jgi:hypothetical protein